MVNTREKVETTPNELKVFTEVEETRLMTKHDAGVDLHGDPPGSDVVLQGAEAATGAQIRLKRTPKTCETLTQVGVDAEEWTKPMFLPADVSQIRCPDQMGEDPYERTDDNRPIVRN